MRQLNKTDVEKLNSEIKQSTGKENFYDKKEQLSIVDYEHTILVLKNKTPEFFYHEGKAVPTLKLLLQQPILKQVIVDMGAVKFVSSGADIMRPGIKELDHTIIKDEFVVVVDQTHKKPLCVAQALFSGEEIYKMQKGKALKNIHYVGDKVWKYEI
ncbi:RNA-binding protein [Candidatus Woesearchaeota archaeon]|nr:RNA-binding protein [Candidatus Woesearchaeota archaeon]